MATSELTNQFFNVTPATRGQCVVIDVDTVSRAYDIGGLAWGGRILANGHSEQMLFLELLADTSDVYYHFRPDNSADLSDTASIAVGTAAALTNSHCQRLVSNTPYQIRMDRLDHRYLVIKTASGTAKLRISLASQPNLG